LKEAVWAAAPIHDSSGNVIGAILVESLVLQSVTFKSDSVREAYEKYVQLQRGEKALRFTVLLMLVLSTLLIVFAFSWFAMYLAKRIMFMMQARVDGAAVVVVGVLGSWVEGHEFFEFSVMRRFSHYIVE